MEYKRVNSNLLPSRINPEENAAEAPGMKLNGPKTPEFPAKDIRKPPREVAANPILEPRISPINGEITADNAMNFPGAPITGKSDHRDRRAYIDANTHMNAISFVFNVKPLPIRPVNTFLYTKRDVIKRLGF